MAVFLGSISLLALLSKYLMISTDLKVIKQQYRESLSDMG